jgi:hypothetical protein
MGSKYQKIVEINHEELAKHPWIHKSPEYVPPVARPRYYDWDPEIECIDAPLIPKSIIPPGYEQSWDSKKKEYVLRHKHKTVIRYVSKTQTDKYIQFRIRDDLYYVIDLRKEKNPPVQDVA